MEGRGMRPAATGSGGARSGFHHRLGQQRCRFRHDIRRILLQGSHRPGDGGNQARRRDLRARLRHPRPQHFRTAGDPAAVAAAQLSRESRACCQTGGKLVCRPTNLATGETAMPPAEAQLRQAPSGITEAEWSQRVNLAACYRLVAHYGWDDLVDTHISARVPGPEHHFLINPYGTAVASSLEGLLPLNQTAQLVTHDLAYHDYE